MNTAEEYYRDILGQMVDLSIKFRPLQQESFYCVFCQKSGITPPKVEHLPYCIVLKAKEALGNDQG